MQKLNTRRTCIANEYCRL